MKKSIYSALLFFMGTVLFAQNSAEEYFTHLHYSNAYPLLHSDHSQFDVSDLSDVSVPLSFTEGIGTSSHFVENRILLRSNNRFEVWGLVSEDAAADTVIKVLSNNYDRVADSLNTSFSHKIIVDIYPDLATYHAAIGWPTAPDWVVGNATGDDKIDMVSPYNPGPAHTFSSIINVVTHEMVHNFVAYLTPGFSVPIWINEGAATFLAYQTASNAAVCSYVTQNSHEIPTLTQLGSGGVAFGDLGGYTFAYTIAEFIVTEQGGAQALSSLMSSGMNFSLVGFTNEQSFEYAWNRYLYVEYPCVGYGGLHAAFAADFTSGDGPLTISFTDYSAQYGTPINSWEWDFDDDGVIDSYLENPVFTYTQMGTYTVALTVKSGAQTSTYIRSNYIDVLSTGGVGEIEGEQMKLKIYPNPTRDQLNIEVEGSFVVTIRNLMGQEMRNVSGSDRLCLDVHAYPEGIYLVVIESDQGTAVKRVLIQE